MKPKQAIVIGFLAAVGVIMYLALGHKSSPSPGNQAAGGSGAVAPNGSPAGAQAVRVNLLAVAGSAAWEGVPDIRMQGGST